MHAKRADASHPPFQSQFEPAFLLRDLTADFAARIVLGMDVDIVLAGFEIGGVRIGQGGAAPRPGSTSHSESRPQRRGPCRLTRSARILIRQVPTRKR